MWQGMDKAAWHNSIIHAAKWPFSDAESLRCWFMAGFSEDSFSIREEAELYRARPSNFASGVQLQATARA